MARKGGGQETQVYFFKGILYLRGIIFFPNQIHPNSAILHFFTGAL